MALPFLLCAILGIVLVLVAVGVIIALVLKYVIPKNYQTLRGMFGFLGFFALSIVALMGLDKLCESTSYVLVVVENNEEYSKYRVFGDGGHLQTKISTEPGKSYIDNRSDKDIIIESVYYGKYPLITGMGKFGSNLEGQIIKTGTSAECENFPNFFFEEPSSIEVDKNKDKSIVKRWVLNYLRYNTLPDAE